MNNIENYVMYRERLQELIVLKAKLKKEIKVLAKIRTNYKKYLSENPYKEPRIKHEKSVNNLREELMKLIPDNPLTNFRLRK